MSLVNCNMLEVLDLGKNLLNDSFPAWLGDLPRFQVLVLRHNNFHGRIGLPTVKHGFRNLRIIDLLNNFHTGDLPSSYFRNWRAMSVSNENQSESSSSTIRIFFPFIARQFSVQEETYIYGMTITNKGSETFYPKILTVFRVIDFSSNEFTGNIPIFIGDLIGLQALHLSDNNLFGPIPSSLANISGLESLDLSLNKLSGTIPSELTKLSFLEVFNVSHNRLMGSIPQGQQFSTFDETSFEGDPK